MVVVVIVVISVLAMNSPRYPAPDQTDGWPAILRLRFDPEPIAIGEDVTVLWDVRRADSVSILPLVENVDPALGRYTLIATWEVFEDFTIIVANEHGETTRTLRVNRDSP